jgi:hypothetical protein
LRIGPGLQAPDFYPFRAKTPKVSGRTPEYSHFRETGTGDWVSFGTTWQALRPALRGLIRDHADFAGKDWEAPICAMPFYAG